MRKVWRLFSGDLHRLTANVVSVIIVIGLVMIPSLFTWFNVAASWDPFANTKNLTIAVANTDAGYKGEIIPMRVNVGEDVISALRANKQLNWVFVDEHDAVDGTKSGRYYASIVIPKDFSTRMLTLFSSNKAVDAPIIYYTNEKKNALAPKVTGEGADEMSAQIDRIFVKTVADVVLDLTSALLTTLNKDDARSATANLYRQIETLTGQLRAGSSLLDAYSGTLDASVALIDSSNALLRAAGKPADDSKRAVDHAVASAGTVEEALNASSRAVATAIAGSLESYDALGGSIDKVFAGMSAQSGDASASLRRIAGDVDGQVDALKTIRAKLAKQRDDLRAIERDERLPDVVRQAAGDSADRLDGVIADLDSSVRRLVALRNGLRTSADDVDASDERTAKDRRHVASLIAESRSSLSALQRSYDSGVKSQIAELSSDMESSASGVQQVAGDLATTADAMVATSVLHSASGGLTSAADDLAIVASKIHRVLESGDLAALRQAIGSDPDALAASLSMPVSMNRKAIFPVANFGTAMTPFYTALALWVGSLLMAVTVRTDPSRRTILGIPGITPEETYLGRFGVFAVISLMQSTMLCGGDILFLGIQTVYPWLFMLAGWASGLLFVFFIYTLVAVFGNVGKAIAVLFLVMQISGAGGAYPLQVLPEAFQRISPFLPATHTIDAMRAAIAGIYANDYWVSLGRLALFIPPVLVLGLALKRLLRRFNAFVVAKLGGTKLM